jgi:hypothetical protein
MVAHRRSASTPDNGVRATCQWDEAARKAFDGSPGPSVGRFAAAGHEPNRVSSASRVVCRYLERPQAVSGVLESAATLTNRSRYGCCWRCPIRATRSERAPRDV